MKAPAMIMSSFRDVFVLERNVSTDRVF